MSWVGAAIGGGLSGLGNWLAGKENRKAQEAANKSNEKIAREANTWQEKLANSQYQRQMSDLKKAGLNPMLAMNLGGAAVPSAKTAQMVAPRSELSNIASGIQAGSETYSAIQQQQASARQAQTQAEVNKAKIHTEAATAKQANAQALKATSEASINKARIKGVKANAEYEQKRRKLDKDNAEIDKRLEQLDRASGVINPFRGIRGFFKNSAGKSNRTYNPRHEWKIDKRTGEILN